MSTPLLGVAGTDPQEEILKQRKDLLVTLDYKIVILRLRVGIRRGATSPCTSGTGFTLVVGRGEMEGQTVGDLESTD